MLLSHLKIFIRIIQNISINSNSKILIQITLSKKWFSSYTLSYCDVFGTDMISARSIYYCYLESQHDAKKVPFNKSINHILKSLTILFSLENYSFFCILNGGGSEGKNC